MPKSLFFSFPVISRQRDVLSDDGDGSIPIILSFDEMTLHKDIQFDQAEQQVLGPHNNVQVAMVRGLMKNFLQPVFYDYDQPMVTSVLHQLIDKLEDIGLTVEAIVSDMGATNVALWKQLKVDCDNTSFDYKGRRINVFADVPHLLKLLRNHFLDEGLVLPSGTVLAKEDLLRYVIPSKFGLFEKI